MSEQIQSVLQQMQNKFQQSFSQINLDDPVNKELNPQSIKKNQQNKQKNNINILNDQSGRLIFQLDQQKQQNIQNNRALNKQQKKALNQKSPNSKQFQSTPNFKQKNRNFNNQNSEIPRTISQQQFEEQKNYSQYEQSKPFGYTDLTIKLQKALNKISSDKILGTMKHKNIQSITNTMYNRFQQYQQKKKKQIQRKKQQILQNQIRGLRPIPKINSHSRAIVQQISQDPLYLRTEKIIAKKKQKQAEYQKIKQQKSQQYYQKYKQQYDSYMDQVKNKYKNVQIRDSQQYYKYMELWVKAKQKNLQAKKANLIEQQKKQASFKPLINSKSQKILLSKKNQKRVPIYQRQIKPKQVIVDKQCTFKPKISKGNFYKKNFIYEKV